MNIKTIKENGLPRSLGLFDASMIVMGIMVGSGIFTTTGIMAESLPSPGLVLLTWLIGGVLVVCGALSLAELSAIMPAEGGMYVYIRKIFGNGAGFLYGWMMMVAVMPGGIGALSIAFAEYFGFFFPDLSCQAIFFTYKAIFFHSEFTIRFSAGHFVAMTLIMVFSIVVYLYGAYFYVVLYRYHRGFVCVEKDQAGPL